MSNFQDLPPPGNDGSEEVFELQDIFLAGVGLGGGGGGLRILLSPHHAPLHRCFRWVTMTVVVFIVCPGSCGGGGGDGG